MEHGRYYDGFKLRKRSHIGDLNLYTQELNYRNWLENLKKIIENY